MSKAPEWIQPRVEDDDTPLTFGMHKGSTPNEIAKHSASYIVWLHENTQRKVSKELYEECCESVTDADDEYVDYDFYDRD